MLLQGKKWLILLSPGKMWFISVGIQGRGLLLSCRRGERGPALFLFPPGVAKRFVKVFANRVVAPP